MKINEAFVAKILINFIRSEILRFGYKKGILGLSGGLDSAVTACLCASALGEKNVIGLIMPYGASFKQDVKDAHAVASKLRIKTRTIDILPCIDAYFEQFPTEDNILKGNKMARERMSILYDFSAREEALIIGTSNKTELLLGYGTIHGDMACAINPLGDLYKTQVRLLGKYLKIPENVLKKAPTAGLWPGQSDEAELGLAYDEMDKILFQLVDKRKSPNEIISAGYKKRSVDRILQMIKKSEFKRTMPPIAKISERTIGHDFLFPYDQD